MGVFRRVLVIDWSAAATPRRDLDSIWTSAVGAGEPALINHPTRAEAERWVTGWLAAGPGPVLVGCDWSFGYPAGFADSISPTGSDGEPWERVWRELTALVVDDERNRNNRFAVAAELNRRVGPGPGPLWGCPPSAVATTLSPRKAPGFPHGELAEYRAVEVAMRRRRRYVASGWQLLGAGSVGGQILTGIPVLQRLRCRFGTERVRVWPFDTGFVADPTGGRDDVVVLAEVWPSGVPQVALAADGEPTPVRDAVQVVSVASVLAAADADGRLRGWFAPSLEPALAEVARREEGWILAPPIETTPPGPPA